MEVLSATTNSGSIRAKQKARWGEQTYPMVPTKPASMGT